MSSERGSSTSRVGSITARGKMEDAVGYMKSSKSKIAHLALLEDTMPTRVRKLMLSELLKEISKRAKRNSLIVAIVPIPVPEDDDDDEYDEEVDVPL